MKNNKLSEDQILEIKDRVSKGESVANLANEFGTSRRVIYYQIGKSGSKKTNELAMARLERENQALKLVLAETMLELDKEKKTKIAKRLKKHLSKREISKLLKISRKRESASRQQFKDEQLKKQILELREKHSNYGTDRLFIAASRSKSVIHRVVKKYSLQIKRRRKPTFKPEDRGFKASQIDNLTKNLIPLAPNLVWASDFTYINFKNRTYYWATFIDIFSRKIVGWNFSDTHDTELILEALRKAITSENRLPDLCHSDQGSEYRSAAYQEILESYGIKQSMSPKASPWRNGFQESFYAGFKADLKDIRRFNQLGELIEAIAHTIHYYNSERIHSALKTSPVKFLEKYSSQLNQRNNLTLAKVILFQKVVP